MSERDIRCREHMAIRYDVPEPPKDVTALDRWMLHKQRGLKHDYSEYRIEAQTLSEPEEGDVESGVWFFTIEASRPIDCREAQTDGDH
jgi:hypothetical protein